LPAIRETLAPELLYDWDGMCSALAAETPWWEPGTKHGYHAVTFGWLIGEVIRRVTGKTVGAYFREAIAGPLGIDAHIGLAEEDDARCASLQNARRIEGQVTFADRIREDPQSMTAKAFTNPITIVLAGTVMSRAWRGAQIPSVNGHATARAIAKLYGAVAVGGTLDGVRVMSREAVSRCAEEHSHGPDAILGIDTRFGLGFMLPQPHDPFGRAKSFGHPGAGGALGFVDPEARIGFGYTPNRMGTSILGDPRALSLIDAMYACL
jgi:CubicO group peptidase (beta-lactamase class C family)